MFQLVLLSAFFFCTLFIVDRAPSADDEFILKKAQRLDSFANNPPTDSANWSRVILPDTRSVGAAPHRSVWYRLNFDLSRFSQPVKASDNRWAVYIRTTNANFAVYLNGAFLGDGGRMEPPIPSWRRPMMFTFPASLLKQYNNTLYLHEARGVPRGVVFPFFIGPVTKFEMVYDNMMFMKQRLPVVTLTMMAILTVIMLLMFYLRPQDKVFGWYAASVCAWMIHNGMRVVDAIPLENHYFWRAFSYFSLALFVSFGTRFIGCFVNVHFPRIDKVILLWSTLGGLPLFVLGLFHGPPMDVYGEYIWVPSILLIGSYGFYLMLVGVKRENTIDNRLFLLAMAFLMIVGFRDYLFDFYHNVPGTTFYLQFGAGLVMAFWAIILMRRFATALDTAEFLNNELEHRVTEKSRELEAFYDESLKIERERALVEERERIMRDMHDGLGGQLVQVLSMADQNPELSPVRETLRLALRDLRLIIDSLSIVDGDLSTVLGTFRYRSEKMIKKVGLQYHWQVGDVPSIEHMGPAKALQVLRILQQAISNIMQHASATTITIGTSINNETTERQPAVIIEITDDGCGFSPEAADIDLSNGHGLKNMQLRASRIGGSLAVNSSSKGTSVCLSLPLK